MQKIGICCINDVLPEFISLALGRDTKGHKLNEADLHYLELNNIAERWVGTRAVAFDGFPTFGTAYSAHGTEIVNALITTHLGSGGASFAPAAVMATLNSRVITRENSALAAVWTFAQSDRVA